MQTTYAPETAADAFAQASLALLELEHESEPQLQQLLERVAAAVARVLGFRTVAISVYRPAWDDYEVAVVHGNESARAALLGTSLEHGEVDRLLDPRFERQGAYLIDRDAFDWDAEGIRSFVPRTEAPPDDHRHWHPQDALIVPLRGGDGSLLGIVSVDEPESGLRPDDSGLELAHTFVGNAAVAIEGAQTRARELARLRTLEQLMQISSRLEPGAEIETSLQLFCDGIHDALGFQKVAVCLADGARLRLAASSGWPADALPEVTVPVDVQERLLDPRFEQEGCFLLPLADALELADAQFEPAYESTANGRGPHAWQRHWLIVPLRGHDGSLRGIVWPDDPVDRLVPGREKLQALRLFADQAARTLELATQLEQIEALHESRRALIDSAPIGIFELGPDRVVRTWNPAAERIYGWSAEEVLGQLNPVVPADEWDAHVERTDRVLEDGQIIEVARTRYRKDGSEIEVQLRVAPIHDRRGDVTGMVVMVEDVTAKVQAEIALRRSEELSRRILEHSNDLVSLMSLDGEVLFNSPSFERILGMPRSDVEGKAWGTRIHPDDVTAARAAVAAAMRGDEPQLTVVRVQHADGSWRLLEGLPSVVRDESGEPELLISVLRDVTERRALEAQAQQAQRVEAVGRLTGGIAHDFNNLLTAIRGYAEIARTRLSGREPDAARAIGETIVAADRAAALTQKLLAFSRQQVLNPVPLDLNLVVQGLYDLLSRLLGAPVKLRLELEPSLGLVMADAVQLEQVIVNLAINGRDAMPNGGDLVLATSMEDRADGRHVVLTVRDNGSGMTDEVRARAFEPFFTTKGPGEGTGLGLATVYGIINQSNGYVDLESAPGEGTSVTLGLPCVDAVEQVAGEPETATSRGGSERILLVEDNDVVRAVTASLLRSLGYDVVEAGTPHEADALDLDGVDLVVCDVLLPELNGRELVDRMLCRRADMRALFISGYAPDGTVGAADHLLQKPFSEDELAAAVRDVLDRK